MWVLVEGYPGFSHERVLDTAHLHTACLSPVQEKYAGVREGVKLGKQVFALDTVAICVCVVSSRVTLRRGQVHEYLVIAKKVGSVQLEVLVSVFGLQRERDFAAENHVHLSELFSLLNDRLIGQVKSAVKRRYEKRDELFPARCVFIFKYVLELLEKLREELLDQS